MNRNRRPHKRSVCQSEESGRRRPTQLLLGISSPAKGGTTRPPGFCWRSYQRVGSPLEIEMESATRDALVMETTTTTGSVVCAQTRRSFTSTHLEGPFKRGP